MTSELFCKFPEIFYANGNTTFSLPRVTYCVPARLTKKCCLVCLSTERNSLESPLVGELTKLKSFRALKLSL